MGIPLWIERRDLLYFLGMSSFFLRVLLVDTAEVNTITIFSKWYLSYFIFLFFILLFVVFGLDVIFIIRWTKVLRIVVFLFGLYFWDLLCFWEGWSYCWGCTWLLYYCVEVRTLSGWLRICRIDKYGLFLVRDILNFSSNFRLLLYHLIYCCLIL
jgi:hypothetical protein